METSLPAHLAESSVVTSAELELAERWLRSVEAAEAETCEWLDNWIDTSLPFAFRYGGRDGSALFAGWDRQRGREKDGDVFEKRLCTWRDPATGLKLTWRVKLFESFPAVEWVLLFENVGTVETPVVEGIQALRLRLLGGTIDKPYRLHGANGGRSLADDFFPFSIPLPSPSHMQVVCLGGSNPSSNGHLPFFNVQGPDGRGVMVAVGWSGSWVAEVVHDGEKLTVGAGMDETRFVLKPGEQVRSPRVLLLIWQGRRLHGHNMLRQLLHKHYVPKCRGRAQQPMVSVNVAFTHNGRGGFLEQAEEQSVTSLIEPFARLGAELMIVDAGWYEGQTWMGGTGRWEISETKYPRGFRPIAEALRDRQMDFGVWFAPEWTGSADFLPGGEAWLHPAETAWRHPVGQPYRALRMALPEVRQWFLGIIDRMVAQEGLSCYRQDCGGEYGPDEDDRRGLCQIRHVAGLYALWDEMARRHPELVMEGCCGGGRRIDLETVSRFHWHQKSDRWGDVESDQCGLYGANLFLPGGLINVPTYRTDDYGCWSSFAGQLCLGWHPLAEGFPTDQARRQVQRYKRIRHLLCGDFYPLTPCSLDAPYIGLQFHRADLDEGVALIFRRHDEREMAYPEGDRFVARLRGLEPGGRYRLSLERAGEDRQLIGGDLAGGVEVSFPPDKAAEMITYQRA